MSVSQKQTVEILKVLLPRGGHPDPRRAHRRPDPAGDGPASSPVLRNMRADGKAIVIITHKLHEVHGPSPDRGRRAAQGQVHRHRPHEPTPTPQTLTDMMVGRAVSLNIDRPEAPSTAKPRLEVEGLTCVDDLGRSRRLDDVSRSPAIERRDPRHRGHRRHRPAVSCWSAIAGLHPAERGQRAHVTRPTPTATLPATTSPQPGRRGAGRQDPACRSAKCRRGPGLRAGGPPRHGPGRRAWAWADNMMLRRPTGSARAPLSTARPPGQAGPWRLMDELEVVTPERLDTGAPALSGGNVQKVLVGRRDRDVPPPSC